MTRFELEAKGYKFNITPFGWMIECWVIEWNLPLFPYDGDEMLEGNEEAIPTGADLRRCTAKELRGKNLEEIERDAIESANVDWVMRRIRK